MEKYPFEKAQEEAARMTAKIEAGQAKSYPEAENRIERENNGLDFFNGEIVEPHGESVVRESRIVENQELRIRYKETIIELPKHRQEEYRIKRIKRRELLPPFPEGFFEKGDGSKTEEFEKVYKFLTDGNYPSETGWNHVMHPWFDHSDGRQRKDLERHKQEGMYFQKIFPKYLKSQESFAFFEKTERGMQPVRPVLASSGEISLENKYGIFDLWCGPGVDWAYKGVLATPLFVFTPKNTALKKYIQSVESNPESREMISKDYNNFEELEDLINGRTLKPVYRDLRDLNSGMVNRTQVTLPCVRHPDIESLRWCHSTVAIVPTQRSLNVLFFEND